MLGVTTRLRGGKGLPENTVRKIHGEGAELPSPAALGSKLAMRGKIKVSTSIMATWHFAEHYGAADAHFREWNNFERLHHRAQLARLDVALGQTRRQHQKEVEEKPEVTEAQASV